MSYKSQMCEAAKNEYADQLQRTNELQRQYYRSGLPEVFRQLQEMDEKRIKNIKSFICSSVDIERNVFPIINKCLDGIVKAAELINEKEVKLYCDCLGRSFYMFCDLGFPASDRKVQERFSTTGRHSFRGSVKGWQ